MLEIKKLLTGTLSIIALVSLVACSEKTETLINSEFLYPEETVYSTTSAFIGDYESTISTGLSIEYDYDRPVYFGASGYLEELFVSKGDIVEEGDVIASYTTGDSTVSLIEKTLELERLQSEYDREVENYNSEVESNNIILGSLEKDSYEYNIFVLTMEKAEIAQKSYVYSMSKSIADLEEDIEELEDNLEVQYITAPYGGEISDITNLIQGDVISANTMAVKITTYDSLLLKVDDVDGLNWGDEVTVTVGTNDAATELVCTVVSTPSVLSSSLNSVITYIKIDYEASGVTREDVQFSGNSIQLSGTEEYMPNVLLITSKAIKKDGTKYYVEILEDGVLKQRYISVNYNNLDYYWVEDGLNEDQIVVIG